MPIYEFHCEDCGTLFEIRASIKEREDRLKPQCPRCQSEHTRQLLSGFIVLTGDGKGDSSGLLPGCECGSGLCSYKE